MKRAATLARATAATMLAAALAAVAATATSACQHHVSGATGPTAPLIVAAAVSLKAPLEELAHRYEASHPGSTVRFTFGASGDLAHQIHEGAPAALFASAAEAPAKELEDARLTTRSCVLATGALALVRRDGPELAGLRWETLAGSAAVQRLALGLTPSVPAGVYAEQALRALGSLDVLAPKIVRGANARNVLDMVARGEADAAIVYATDALASVQGGSRVVIVGPPPASAAPHVVYPLAIVHDAPADASVLAQALCAPASAAVFAAFGFGPP